MAIVFQFWIQRLQYQPKVIKLKPLSAKLPI